MLTVDVPVGGRRERDIVNGYFYPQDLLRKSLTNVGFTDRHLAFDPAQLPAFAAQSLTVAFTWELVAWLRSLTHLPLLAQRSAQKDDALRAIEYGVDGIVGVRIMVGANSMALLRQLMCWRRLPRSSMDGWKFCLTAGCGAEQMF